MSNRLELQSNNATGQGREAELQITGSVLGTLRRTQRLLNPHPQRGSPRTSEQRILVHVFYAQGLDFSRIPRRPTSVCKELPRFMDPFITTTADLEFLVFIHTTLV